MNVLEEEERNIIIDYYQQGNQRLRDILDRYRSTSDIQVFKLEIADLLMLGNGKRFDEISSPVNHILFESKLQKLKNFRFLINFYYVSNKFISLGNR